MMYAQDRLLQSLKYLYVDGMTLEYQLRFHSLRETQYNLKI